MVDALENATCHLLIDHGALARNWQAINAKTGDAETAACVKADAYGLGAREVGQTLHRAGCKTFYVATVAEGMSLRHDLPSSRIFIFAGLTKANASAYTQHNLIPVLNSPGDIDVWVAHQKDIQGNLPAALFVDTGMNRLGLSASQLADFLADSLKKSALQISTLMTHLSSADEADPSFSEIQLELFVDIARHFPDAEKSLSNSAGAFLGNKFHFNLVRPGIALYGAACGPDNILEPVATAKARILQIRHVKKGETVGYGNSHAFQRDSVIATAGIGYADGYLRALSGAGVPLRNSGSTGACGFLAGQEVPVLGRVSMDYTAFDLSDVPEASRHEGSWVEVFGPNMPIDRVASAAGTIGYEMLTSLGQRYFREHINQGAVT